MTNEKITTNLGEIPPELLTESGEVKAVAKEMHNALMTIMRNLPEKKGQELMEALEELAHPGLKVANAIKTLLQFLPEEQGRKVFEAVQEYVMED